MNLKKNIKYSSLLIGLAYAIINLFFMRAFWSELLFDRSKTGAVYGEAYAVEWGLEHLYQNIISFKNPFAHTLDTLYPFGGNLLATDSGSGFFILLIRPFLSIHQAFYVITALGLLAANFGMYLLLRKLKFNKSIAFILGLSYGYSTFLMVRLGHITYYSIYIFPWFYYFILSVLKSKDFKQKIFNSLGAAFTFVLALYLNLYFFVIIVFSMGLFILYFLFRDRKVFISEVVFNRNYIVLFIFLSTVFLSPWLRILYNTYLFEELPQVGGWGGAIQFSSDLFGYFIPSTYSYFLKFIPNLLENYFVFVRGIFENFSYPGFIILASYVSLIFLWQKKKISKKQMNALNPFLFVALIFWILTLGPFLHVFGKWGLTLDDGVRLVIPLPYTVFHNLPFMSNIRVPGRLAIAFIFFSYFVTAYVMKILVKNKTNKFKVYFFSCLFLIIFVDQYFYIPDPSPQFFPNKAYEMIKQDKQNVSVMEIPSTVRDGFTYFGSGDDIGLMVGQLRHSKPVVGGYFGRVSYYKIAYFKRNPFWGYIGRLIDPDLENNGSVDKSDIAKWQEVDMPRSRDSIDFLDLKYVLLDNQKPYSSTLSALLKELGFKEKLKDNYFLLYQRQPSNREFLSVDIGGLDDDKNLGMGWAIREDGFRWSGKKASVLFRLENSRDMYLRFKTATFYKDQPVTIYVNENKIAKIELTMNLKEFKIPIEKQNLLKGINTIYFMFEETYRPKDVLSNSADDRNISAKFNKISLQDLNN